MDRAIYIVLVKAHTGLGKIARRMSNYDYTHVGVCLDPKLESFITFSRRKHYAPLDAGFMREKREHYAFGKYKSVKVKVFKLPLSEESFKKINGYISKVENDREYVFNLFSMATMPLFHGFRIYKAHNCMSFTGKIIKMSGAVNMKRPWYKYNIRDIDRLLSGYLLGEFKLKKHREDREYMTGYSVFENVKMFFKLAGVLVYRLILL